MRRASPPLPVKDLDLVNITAVDNAPSESDAISLAQSDVRIADGFAQPLNAVLPDKHDYQRLRFRVIPWDHSGGSGGNGITGSPTDAEVTIWQRTADGAMIPFGDGPAKLQADGTFTEVEGDNHDARYYATVTTLTGGTSPAVNARVYVQGVHTPTYVAANA